MKILYSIIFLNILFSGSILSAQSSLNDPVIIGYVFGDRMDKAPQAIEAKKITHINYAFAKITNGKISLGDQEDPKRFQELNNLKRKKPELKILISVGGWGWSNGFSDVALTDSSRTVFANSAIQFLKKYNIDGIDIDWEYPGQQGAGNVFRTEDKQNFTLLLDKIRGKLDSVSGENKKDYLLTIATAANQDYLDHVEIKKIAALVDFINIMSYDYQGDWNTVTSHHTNLLTSTTDPEVYKQSTATAVKEHLDAGAPASKLVIGVAFYGRGWKKVNPTNNGLHQNAVGQAFSLNYSSTKDSLRSGKYHRYWDDSAQAPYLWNEKDEIFITYDDPVSLKKKTDFIKSQNLAGAMFWQYHADDGELLESLFQNLKNENQEK